MEALDILGDIDTTNVGPNALSQYFISLVHLYGELGYYGNVPSRKKLFFEKQQDYMREMYRVTPTDNDYYLQRKEMDCYNRKAYREAHSTLSLRNDDMRRLNEELRMANQALDDTNRQLQAIVSQLNEQTRVKDVYVGRFMSLCSDYIDKIDDFRKRVNRMVKGHEYEELYRLTKSTDMKTMEIENLYAAFDNAFLHLFPNFISDFNALLLPGERIVVQGEYKLNTTLRIFALIRLGIDDSSRIAKFLHYSVNTIYNYRARIKGVAITHRDDFETRVKNIGM